MIAIQLMYSIMIAIVIINTVNGNCPEDEITSPSPSPSPTVFPSPTPYTIDYVISDTFNSTPYTSVHDPPGI